MNAQEHEVVDTIRQYVACAKTMDFAGRKALWDHDEPLPILCPEEATQPLVGWEALDAYWSRSRVTMADLKALATNFTITILADDIALATYDNRWIAHMAGPTEEPAISADVRMNALLRRKPEGWRYFQLVEGPVDLMTMARQAARRSALELFPELELAAT
jgi:hypothetical protein